MELMNLKISVLPAGYIYNTSQAFNKGIVGAL